MTICYHSVTCTEEYDDSIRFTVTEGVSEQDKSSLAVMVPFRDRSTVNLDTAEHDEEAEASPPFDRDYCSNRWDQRAGHWSSKIQHVRVVRGLFDHSCTPVIRFCGVFSLEVTLFSVLVSRCRGIAGAAAVWPSCVQYNKNPISEPECPTLSARSKSSRASSRYAVSRAS